MDDIQNEQNSEQTTDSTPQSAPVHFVRRGEQLDWTAQGNAAAQRGDYEAAADAFANAVDENPDDGRARYNLALAQQYLGDAESAIAGYRRAIDLDPGLIDAYVNLGNLYSELGMFEESLETFQQGLELDPANSDIYLSVGDAYRLLNMFQDAIQAYRQTLIVNPENTQAAENLRDVRERTNEQWRRIMELERRIDDEPANPVRYAELSSQYLDMRRYNDALSSANQMLTLDPEGRTAYDMLAAVYEQ